MCGFAGFLDLSDRTPADELAARVEAMALAIQYRGPDDSGVWVDGEAGVALGHRRLSIVDLSPMGHQPMVSADGRYQLAYNGEVYNWPGLKKELEELGHTFRGHSDTEVMLAAFCRWGVEPSVSRFNGMFAFALWDRKERVLTLARDRIGKKPLYYGWMGNVFLFGSELKALRAHPAWNGVVDRNVLALYLRHNYVPGPYSIYRNVFKVPQGCLAILSPGKSPAQPAITPYWTAAQAARDGMSHPFEGGEPEITDELEKLLLDAVGSRMVADVPLGAFLSGGIDSSLVVALMQAQSPRPVKTFTIGFHEKDYNEAVHAKAVAAHLGTDHTELYVTPPEAMGVIPDLPHMFDEPFADSSQIPTFLVSRLARRQVTVSLSGDGGDELFGGYNRYLMGDELWKRLRLLPFPVRKAFSKTIGSVPVKAWNGLFKTMGPVLPQRLRFQHPGDKMHKLAGALGQSSDALYLGLVSQWKHPEQLVPEMVEPLTGLTNPALRPPMGGFIHRMMYWDQITYLPDDIMVKVDRASMAVSLEARAPLLDHRVVEFAWRLPLHQKTKSGIGKLPLRNVLFRHVPKELIERPKMGFGVPIDHWLRGPLKDWAESLLDEKRMKEEGLINPEPIRKMWNEHQSGKWNWQNPLWVVLMFQSWLTAQRSI